MTMGLDAGTPQPALLQYAAAGGVPLLIAWPPGGRLPHAAVIL